MRITDPADIQKIFEYVEKIEFRWPGIASHEFIKHKVTELQARPPGSLPNCL